MKRQRLISFNHYQKTLRKRGMAIAAEGTSDGQIIFSQVIGNPKCGLLTSMRSTVMKHLSGRLFELNQESKSYRGTNFSDEDLKKLLVEEFESRRDNPAGDEFRKLEWIDRHEPRNGIIAKAKKKDLSLFFQLRMHPSRMKAVWENELNIKIDAKLNGRIKAFIEEELEYAGMEIDPEGAGDLHDIDWEDLDSLDWAIYHGCQSEEMYRKIKAICLAKFLAPIFDNYDDYLLYVASPDTCYFVIGRPYFFPIIAGERSDGAHEITIFHAYNAI